MRAIPNKNGRKPPEVPGEALSWERLGFRLVFGIGLFVLLVWPAQAPVWIGFCLVSAVYPIWCAWRGAQRTALRPSVCWSALALLLALGAQLAAFLEPFEGGKPIAGHWVYLAALATLAALVSVLNARNPGSGAWAILMALLVLVFLIPWLGGPGLARKAHGLERLQLETPWNYFYLLLLITGITNYLPTRFGFAALILGSGLACEYLALTRPEFRVSHGPWLWSLFPWTLALSTWGALCSELQSARSTQSRLERTWFWLRDHWGVVWGLRLQERFNQSAERLGWPIRLGWFGLTSAQGSDQASLELPAAADSVLRGLLRRFADEDRINEATTGSLANFGPVRDDDEVAEPIEKLK